VKADSAIYTEVGMATPKFGTIARRQQAKLLDEPGGLFSAAARVRTDPKAERNGHLLAFGAELENLYPPMRGTNGALEYFAERRIKWWRSARSGDAKDENRPTRNLASSQLACVNFLMPLRDRPDALAALLRTLDADVASVARLVYRDRRSRREFSDYVEFEWVGLTTTLEGRAYTRGANATSADALVVAEVEGGGRRAYLFEWKYVEEYRNDKSKGVGTEGDARRRAYRGLYGAADSAFSGAVPLDDLLYEPFYQLMRLGLLADKMVREREFGSTDARVVVVCPRENVEYRDRITSPGLRKQFGESGTVGAVVSRLTRNPGFFRSSSQEELLRGVRAAGLKGLDDWLRYQAQRYGW
jgi:hypothetical protein